jgi:hypothetical protein
MNEKTVKHNYKCVVKRNFVYKALHVSAQKSYRQVL